MIAVLIALAQAAAPPSPQPACTAAEHRQFDFWVGDWTVTPTGKPVTVAHSRIEKLYGGCVIREDWQPTQKGMPGGGLNNYVREDGRWHQTWVDAANSRVEFAGGLVDGRMVLTGHWKGINGPGKDALIRMTYSRNADGTVRQHGEQSIDQGLSWSTNFDFTYHPKATAKR